MKIKLKIILLLILSISGCKQKESNLKGIDSENIDSLLTWSQKNDIDKKKRIAFLKKADRLLVKNYNSNYRDRYYILASLYHYNSNEKKSFEILDFVKEKSLLFKDTLGLILTDCQIANSNSRTFKIDSAYYYFTKAEKLSTKLKNKPYFDFILLNKADLLCFQRDYVGAEVKAVEALRIAKQKNNNRLIYDCYITIGNSLSGIKNYDSAKDYYQKSIEKSIELKNDPQYLTLKAQPYNYISEIFLNEGDYISAINYVEKALKLANFRKVDPAMFSYLNNKKAIAKIRMAQDGSLEILEETLRIGDSLENSSIRFTSRFYLAEYYLSVGDTLRAKEYCEDGKEIAAAKKIFEDELKTLELLAKIDFKNSAFYNERYIALSDSLQNVERATRNKFARIEFETDEITNQKNLAETEKEKISAQRWMILGFSLFFIVLLMLLYVSHRQRSKNRELQYLQQQQKANEEIYRLMLDQQQKIEEGKQIEKRRISKELHDGVMGKLTSIRLNLFVLGRNPDAETLFRCMEHVNEIQNIEKEIRKISHDLNQNLFTNVSDFTLMVNNLVDNIKEHSGIHFRIITDEKIDWNTINGSVKMQVYRILQEALQNIVKYAKAKNVVISMLEKEQQLSVTITDDGVGFDTRSSKSGIGHKNMRERASEIKGEFAISSIVGKGTKINLIIPT